MEWFLYKAWESTTHVSSSGMPLHVWSVVLGPACRMSRHVLLSQSFSSEAHVVEKIKHSFHFVASSSSFSPLCSPSVLPIIHHFKLGAPQSRNLVLLHACEMPKQNTNTVPVIASKRNYQGAQDQSQMIHLEGRVAFIHTLLIFILLQNLGQPTRN